MHRRRFLLLGASFALTGLSAPLPPAAGSSPARRIRIVLVGDSTVTDAVGWGAGFKRFVDPAVAECVNTSYGGRSSRSFIAEGRWKAALALHGDYYLIQFGHNDIPGKGPARETDPATTYPEFMARYVDEARAIGATPILVTSLAIRAFDPHHPRKLKPLLAPYVAAVRKLAAEKHVPLIDLAATSTELCERLGEAGCAPLSARLPSGRVDITHLSPAGSLAFARLVVSDLRRLMPSLAPALRPNPTP